MGFVNRGQGQPDKAPAAENAQQRPSAKTDGTPLPPLPRDFEEPPEIPGKGLFVPKSTMLYASKLRKQKQEDPLGIPYRLYIWLAQYEQAHPFGFAKQERLEEEWQKVNEDRGADVEEAKGNRTYKIIEAEAKRDSVHKDIYDVAFTKLKEAVELGATITRDAIKTEIKGMEKSNSALVNTVEKQGSLVEKMFAERESIFDDRVRLLEMMRDQEEGRPVDPIEVKGRWERIFGTAKKFGLAFAPMLKGFGVDISPFLIEEKPPEAPPVEASDDEPDEEEAPKPAPKEEPKKKASAKK